jgi:hypothetical protein
MKTFINALLVGSLMTSVAFAGDPAPKADKTAPAAPATDKKTDTTAAKKTDDKATATDTTKKTDTSKKTDAKKDVKAPATK